ncbi:MAG: IS200/IS605 family transposase [Bacteroidales bacterium]|nr:IS200/IS605 family transposase [Bacteroidales bacterium]
MANTYTQINIHAIFAVKGRENVITEKFRDELFKYISGMLKNIGQYPLAVNGYRDHIHVFFELHPTKALSEIIGQVKANSSKWINDKHKVLGKFAWQEGYGGFSYSRSQRDDVINYIINQEKHHKTSSFRDEYMNLLKKFEIDFKDEYVFEFFD